jgi:exopolysaccharide production protein ExoQ
MREEGLIATNTAPRANWPGDRAVAVLVAAVFMAAGPVGVVAPKGLTVLVILGGLVGLARWNREGRPMSLFPPRLTLVVVCLLAWGAVTALWAPQPDRVMAVLASIAGLGFAGLALFRVARDLESLHRHRMANGLLGGFALALAALAVGYAFARLTGESLWGEYYFDPLTTMNNGAVVVALFVWPVFGILWFRAFYRTAVAVVVLVPLFLALFSSGAALAACVVGGTGFLIAAAGGRRAVWVMAALLALAVLSAPSLIREILTPQRIAEWETSLPSSAAHRLAMWRFAVEKIDAKPLFGWGLDSSRSIPQEDRRLAPNMEIMPLHPHNAALQMRLELGLPGALILAALALAVFSAFSGGGRVSAAIAVAAALGYVTVGALSFGVWQSWWISASWLLAAMTCMAADNGGGDP